MLVISILVLILRGPLAGIPAFVMFGIVALRHAREYPGDCRR
jgi:hypothetical protein